MRIYNNDNLAEFIEFPSVDLDGLIIYLIKNVHTLSPGVHDQNYYTLFYSYSIVDIH